MEHNKIKIIVLTRFSVYMYNSGMVQKHKKNVQSKEDYINLIYSKKRLDEKLFGFSALTLPSIVSQTYSPYNWYIFYSKELPSYYKDQMEKLIKPYPFIQLILVKSADTINSKRKQYAPSSPYISVRLDDDDALNINYFKILASNYKPNYILSPVNGLTLSNIDKSTLVGKSSKFSYKNNICAASGLAYADHNVFALGSHRHLHETHTNIIYLKNPELFVCIMNNVNVSVRKHTRKSHRFSITKYIHPNIRRTMTRKK